MVYVPLSVYVEGNLWYMSHYQCMWKEIYVICPRKSMLHVPLSVYVEGNLTYTSHYQSNLYLPSHCWYTLCRWATRVGTAAFGFHVIGSITNFVLIPIFYVPLSVYVEGNLSYMSHYQCMSKETYLIHPVNSVCGRKPMVYVLLTVYVEGKLCYMSHYQCMWKEPILYVPLSVYVEGNLRYMFH